MSITIESDSPIKSFDNATVKVDYEDIDDVEYVPVNIYPNYVMMNYDNKERWIPRNKIKEIVVDHAGAPA